MIQWAQSYKKQKQTKNPLNSALLQSTRTNLTAKFPCPSLPLFKIVTTRSKPLSGVIVASSDFKKNL